MIIITEYAINRSLNYHLRDPDKRRSLTWEQRLKICLGAAKGLTYLHSGLGERGTVIQREPNSRNILLDENMEAKLSDFGNSVLIPRNQPHGYACAAGTQGYIDPVYLESNIVTSKTDIYALGVVLFEVLTGRLAGNHSTFENGKPQLLIQSVRRSYDVGMERLIDPFIRDQMDRSSFSMVKEIAYKCISFNTNNRPRLDVIVKTMESALAMQKCEATSSVVARSLQHQKSDFFRSPLREIKLDTRNLSSKTPLITDDGSPNVYRGKFSESCQNHEATIKHHDRKSSQGKEEFRNELKLISSFNHENIIPFIGYYDQGNEKIIVTEYAINGSLDYHLKDPIKRGLLTWSHRLKICLGVARGLKYFHSGLEERGKVVHGEPSSRNILLDENMEAKLCDFGRSVLLPRNQPHVYERLVGIHGYVDPASQESGFPKTEADVYTFGVVMFELFSGMLASELENLKDVSGQRLINQEQRCYDDELDMIVDRLLRDQVDCQFLHAFIDLAYECISLEIRRRPSINMIIKRIQELMDFQNRTITIQSHHKQKLEDFLIPLEEIKRAIGGDFSSKNQAGDGGFGVVYKGQLSELWKNRTVAIKRLHPSDYDGNKEFHNEIKLIFRFQHENIIPFIGYCDEGGEMIIVTEYASNGSLDCYLEDEEKRGRLTWTQRLKMCLGTARGLNHLHSAHGKGNTVIHRDIKSANILLDDNLEPKICDFGLSRLHLKTHLDTDTGVYTKQAGTMFYMDPTYQESGKLRTQSDVYSFGVVMFEMLSGMMAHHHKDFGDGRQQLLIGLVRRYYATGGLD